MRTSLIKQCQSLIGDLALWLGLYHLLFITAQTMFHPIQHPKGVSNVHRATPYQQTWDYDPREVATKVVAPEVVSFGSREVYIVEIGCSGAGRVVESSAVEVSYRDDDL